MWIHLKYFILDSSSMLYLSWRNLQWLNIQMASASMGSTISSNSLAEVKNEQKMSQLSSWSRCVWSWFSRRNKKQGHVSMEPTLGGSTTTSPRVTTATRRLSNNHDITPAALGGSAISSSTIWRHPLSLFGGFYFGSTSSLHSKTSSTQLHDLPQRRLRRTQ